MVSQLGDIWQLGKHRIICGNALDGNVSFVSVTQQFNTTSSMGRLTLNMLLSFAQFEREITGERIRDKFAASKKKGLWMGGSPPLGYRVNNRELEIIEKEAKIVRSIFQKNMTRRTPLVITAQLNAQNITTKTDGRRWILSQDSKPMVITSHKSSQKKPTYNIILMAVAEAYIWKDRLIKEQITVKQLAHKLSINPNFIYKRLKLLSLSSTILKQITSNSLSPLISIKD